MIPLLAQPFAEHTPESWQAYVRSLYVAPPVKAPPAEYSARLNEKGRPVITVRRTPKYLLHSEISTLAKELGWPLQTLWLEVLKRKIAIKTPERPARRRR